MSLISNNLAVIDIENVLFIVPDIMTFFLLGGKQDRMSQEYQMNKIRLRL